MYPIKKWYQEARSSRADSALDLQKMKVMKVKLYSFDTESHVVHIAEK